MDSVTCSAVLVKTARLEQNGTYRACSPIGPVAIPPRGANPRLGQSGTYRACPRLGLNSTFRARPLEISSITLPIFPKSL